MLSPQIQHHLRGGAYVITPLEIAMRNLNTNLKAFIYSLLREGFRDLDSLERETTKRLKLAPNLTKQDIRKSISSHVHLLRKDGFVLPSIVQGLYELAPDAPLQTLRPSVVNTQTILLDGAIGLRSRASQEAQEAQEAIGIGARLDNLIVKMRKDYEALDKAQHMRKIFEMQIKNLRTSKKAEQAKIEIAKREIEQNKAQIATLRQELLALLG